MRTWLNVGWITLCLLSPLRAQQPPPDDFEPTAPALSTKETKRKMPGFWHRPSEATPEAQLRLADGLQAEGRLRAARKAYNALVHQWHDAREALTAQMALAVVLEQQRKYRASFDEFQYLVEHYAGKFPYEKALQHQFRIANEVLHEKHGGLLFFGGMTLPERALPMFERIVANAPGSPLAPEAQFRAAAIQEEADNLDEASLGYEAVANRYAQSAFGEDAAFRRAVCLHGVAMKAPRDETECRKAMSALALFAARFPESKDVPEAQRRLAELREHLAGMYFERAAFYDKAGKTRAATLAYTDLVKKFPSSAFAVRAAERIHELSGGSEAADAKK